MIERLTKCTYRGSWLAAVFLRLFKRALRIVGGALLGFADRLPRTLHSVRILPPVARELVARNAAFRGKHAGRRCFVIGNGQSLREHNLRLLASEITLVVNVFWRHPQLDQWQPTYYSLIDPRLFELEEPSMREFWQQLRARVHRSTFFVPIYYNGLLDTRRLVEEEGILPAANVYYVAIDQAHSRERSLEVDLCGFLHSVWNVVQLNMLLAIEMGCSPIILLGLDHDWLAHRSEQRHFYEQETLRWTLNRPSPDRQDTSYRALMERQLQLWHHYETIAMIARQRGIEILNATPGSYLDVYPTVDFTTLFPPGNAASPDV